MLDFWMHIPYNFRRSITRICFFKAEHGFVCPQEAF